MCFQRMREKVQAREYRTWQAFIEDFELICSNAMTYNQKRSLIHKAALNLLRHGKKHLHSWRTELEGKRAIHNLHPDGPARAAQEEAAAVAQQNAGCAAAATAAPSDGTPQACSCTQPYSSRSSCALDS
jgi:Bromodomain